MRRKHATASVRLHANAWTSEDVLPAGLAVASSASSASSASAVPRPCSLSSAGDPPSVLSESTDAAAESEGEQPPIPEEDEQQQEDEDAVEEI
jgi:hypothetical protein